MKNKTFRDVRKNNNDVKIIDISDIHAMGQLAQEMESFRSQILLHDSFTEKPQRFVNILTKQTYVRPHNHKKSGHWELMSWVSGIIFILLFDDDGNVVDLIKMSENQTRIIEIPANVFHGFVTLDVGAYLEIRNCSYDPDIDRSYAQWSPPQNTAEAGIFLEKLRAYIESKEGLQ